MTYIRESTGEREHKQTNERNCTSPVISPMTLHKLPGNEPRQLKSSLRKKTVHELLKVIGREQRSWGEDEHKTWSVGRFRRKAIRLGIGSRFHRVNRRFERYWARQGIVLDDWAQERREWQRRCWGYVVLGSWDREPSREYEGGAAVATWSARAGGAR